MNAPRRCIILASTIAALLGGQTVHAQKNAPGSGGVALSEVMMKSMKPRSIGPAIMGGRVSAIALDPSDRFTYYVGLGTGGVMKTADNGATFAPVFEREAVAAVGAVAVAPSNSRHVWVGTGEANDRNSSSWGNGVYVSRDGGGTWTNMGLKGSKTIARIIVHPTDTSTVYVAALGDLWNPGPDRGLHKTTDGGKTWRTVLSAPAEFQNRVGCGDVVMDPKNPSTLYATLYARRRTPWSFTSGASATEGKDVGGIFKTTDGGATWKKLSGGLPGRTQNIGLDVFPGNPSILYAIVQSDEGGASSIDEVYSKKGGVFRSEDAGGTWTRTSRLNPRPFYFSRLRVDPVNDQRVYVLGFALHVSNDGGRTFQEEFFKNVHPDLHDLAIDPLATQRLVLGTDGGVYQSFNGGKQWQFLPKFASGEFYRITLDSSTPYRIAGGLQDNNNWMGPSMTRSKEGILNSDWVNLGGGDGFYCVFDPIDSTTIYAESQGGEIHRINIRTGEMKGLQPRVSEGQPAYRFHWNTPFLGSAHTKGVMYLAGNHVFRLTERGEHYEVISGELSARDPTRNYTSGSGAENYGVVYALAESPLRAGMLWAGTDDGKLWVTRDDGKNWTDLTSRLPSAVKGMWINRIEPGHFDAEVAYLSIMSYPSGVYAPLVFRTADGGKSWKSVAGNLPSDGPVKVIREDLRNPDLLFAGTEFGLYASLDGGKNWTKMGGLPTNSVDDLAIHPREMDLVVATHGRSLYVYDDIRPLQELTAEVFAKPAHLFSLRPASGFYPLEGWAEMSGSAEYRGQNPPIGAMINYYVRELTTDDLKIAITNAAGRAVANLTAPATPGIQRVIWDLRPGADLLTQYGGEGRKFMPSGEYTVTLTYGKLKESRTVRVSIAEGIETR